MITRKIQCALAIILNSVLLDTGESTLNTLNAGEGVLTKTYAKVYANGSGWYTISGYASDGSDVYPLIELINELKMHYAALKEGGYYFSENGEIMGTY